MKHLSFLFLSVILLSCANNNERDPASQEQEDYQQMERAGDFGRENRN